MSKPTTRAALLRSTVVPSKDDGKELIAVKGDNMPPTELPSANEVHEAIEATLQAIVTSENAIEYARQKLAYQFELRHKLMLLTEPEGSVPYAHTLATSSTAMTDYLAKLAAEFAAATSPTRKSLSTAEATKYNATNYGRIRRALELFAHIEWAKANGMHAEFNTDKGRWNIAPACLIPPGWIGAGDLVFLPDGKTLRTTIELEADNKSAVYFISKPRMPMRNVSPSLSQFIYAMQFHVKAATNPTVDTSPAEGTPETAKRAARQTVAKTAETTAASDAPATDGNLDADKPANITNKTWACTQFANALVVAAKFLAMDDMTNFARGDIGDAAWNAMVDIVVAYDRLQGDADNGAQKKERVVKAKRAA
jgi:hypothetical protein